MFLLCAFRIRSRTGWRSLLSLLSGSSLQELPLSLALEGSNEQTIMKTDSKGLLPVHFPNSFVAKTRPMAPSLASLSVAAVLSSAALLAPTADAHQVVLLPAPTYTTDDKDTKYAPLAFLENQGYETVEDFNAWRRNNGYKTLRAFMDGAKYTVTDGADYYCGFTNADAAPQAIPAGNAMRSTGYTHDGPCEVWLDTTRVLTHDNCHAAISGKDYTIDYSSCTGTCTLRWYWLGVRFLKNEYSWPKSLLQVKYHTWSHLKDNNRSRIGHTFNVLVT